MKIGKLENRESGKQGKAEKEKLGKEEGRNGRGDCGFLETEERGTGMGRMDPG